MNKSINKETFANIWHKITDGFFLDINKSPRQKLFSTIWALFFGLLISAIVISFSGHNPFSVFGTMLVEGSTTFGNKFVSIFVAYTIASLAVALCFKSGLFNIGISGQMMASGFVTLVIYRSELLTKSSISSGFIFLAFFMSIIVGAFFSAIAAFIKVYFKVNEVVTTIMLNWIIFFLIKFLVQELASWDMTEIVDNKLTTVDRDFLANGDSLANDLSLGYTLPNFFYPTDLKNSWFSNSWNWIILSISILLIIGVWIIFKKTSFGYKIRMIGLNRDAASYSGTNKNVLVILVMTISGALSGLAGFIWYMGTGGQLDISIQPPQVGFDTIAISLLVYNNPIGIFFSSWFYGLINAGSTAISTEFIGMPREINEIIIGIIVYLSAIAIIFTKFNLLTWLKNFFILSREEEFWKAYKQYLKANWSNCKNKWKYLIEVNTIRKNNIKKWKEIQKEYKSNIRYLENEFNIKYKTKKFDIKLLSTNDCGSYFEEVAKEKKKMDMNLAINNYFLKNNIKSNYINEFKEAKIAYQDTKSKLILDYYNKKEHAKKGVENGNI